MIRYALLALVVGVSAAGIDGPEASERLAFRSSCAVAFAEPVQRFLAARPPLSLWIGAGAPTRQAAAVIATLARAYEHGLDPADYAVAGLDALRSRLGEGIAAADDAARFELAMSTAVLCYASDLHRGRVRPRAVGLALADRGAFPGDADADVEAFVIAVAQNSDPDALFAALAPQLSLYRGLVAGLSRYRALSQTVDGLRMAVPTKLRAGDRGEGVPLLRAYLGRLGDLRSDDVSDAALLDPHFYDDGLLVAVQKFQRRHGLDADGAVGNRTQAALLVPMSDRVRQIELALERLRWLPELDRGLLLVNIPEFRLRVFPPGATAPQLEMKVVVGSAANDTETAIFSAKLEYLVFRPYWHVPYSIASREMLPRLSRDPDYLRRKRVEVVGQGGLSASALASGGARLRQRPGPDNSLGLIKFIFPNRYNIYMHDTPEKRLFARDRRDFSHGCIRLEDAPALATMLLANQGWDRDRVIAATQGSDSFRVNPGEPVPVEIFYVTAIAGEDGEVSFFEDIYDRDPVLSRMLGAAR